MRPTDSIVRGWRAVLAGGLLLTALAAWPASRLTVQTDVTELLPEGSRAAADYAVFLERFGGLERVFVVVTSTVDDGAAARAERVLDAADRLAELLEDDPEVGHVRSGIESADERFLVEQVVSRAPLLGGPDWRARLDEALAPESLHARALALRSALLSQVGVFGAPYLAADPLGFAGDLSAWRPDSPSLTIDPASLGFLSADGEASLVVVTPARAEIDPEGGRALARSLDAAFEAVRETFGGRVEFAAVGGPLYAAHDEEILRADLELTLGGATVGCALLVVLAFGSLTIPAGALLSLVVGVIATLFVIRLGLGSISSIGIGFGAVLVSLGIDYGIHVATRYGQRRMAGDDRSAALDHVFRQAGPAVVTSALTTAAAFAVLTMAHLRPIWELGLLVSVGILVMLIANATVGAACLVGVDRGRSVAKPSGPVWNGLGRIVEAGVELAGARPGSVLAAVLALTLASAYGATRLELAPDLRSMRPTHHPTLVAEQVLVEHFPVGLDTMTLVVTADSLERALDDAAAVEAILVESLGEDVTVVSPTSWLGVPRAIEERLAILGRTPLEPALERFAAELRAAGLDPRGFSTGLDALREMARGRDPGLPPEESWPDWLRELVAVGDEQVSVAIRARLRDGAWSGGPPAAFRQRLDREVPGVALASVAAVGAELRELARRDLRELGILAVSAVFVVIALSFRGDPKRTLLSLVPVSLGSLWILGLCGLFDVSIDIFGVAVLPIIVGIGVDDGLHAVHGARAGAPFPVRGAVLESGRAMLLTTLTTMIGFGSLTFSHIPSLRKGGIVVSCGVLGCLVATLVVLPALERLAERRR